MSEPLVIVGNGMAAACLCEELTQRALGRYAVAVIGEEPRLAYNRVLLSSVLAGEVRASDISLKPAAWWSDRGITLARQYRQSKYVLEHILRPSQLYSGGGAWI
jgi:nitrite reductase (NADH) large subunit